MTSDEVLLALRPVVDGLAATFGQHCEVVLHDYRKPDASVVAIAGAVTDRHEGGAMSEIGLEVLAQGDAAQDRLNYLTRTSDGRTIKSSTMVLRDDDGHVFGALCVNLDVTALRLATAALNALIGDTEPAASTVTTVFSDDIAEIVRTVLEQEEQRLGRPLQYDTKAGRLEIIRALHSRGVFRLPKALQEVAEVLRVSRSTLYVDLNIVRGVELG